MFRQREKWEPLGEARPDEAWEWLNAVVDPIRLHIVVSLLDAADAMAADLTSGPVSPQTLRRHLEALVSTGIVAKCSGASDGETPGRPAARFRLDPSVRDSVSMLVSTLAANRGSALGAA
jgi:predicted ArsR family transcriptional regulator